jgi:TonB-linked SusC/RagA family outer membrane protein
MKVNFTRLGFLITAFLLSMQVYAQEFSVTGKVTSSKEGTTLPGVTVMIKGTSQGSITDIDGNYKISVPSKDAVIIFSYVGFIKQEVPVNGRTTVNIALETDVTQLSEVVVTAFGIAQEKKSLVASAQKVDGQELAGSREANIVDALNAKVAGVQITRQAGSAGAASNIVIRGMSSISGENQPLFVVDGIPINNAYRTVARGSSVDVSNRAIDINPNDIENITVLKGPAATSLYGIQAASGVIIITTKKGRRSDEKNVSVNYSNNIGVDKIMNYFPAQMRFAQGDNGLYTTGTFSHFGPPLTTLRYDGATNNPAHPNGNIVDMNHPSANQNLLVLPVDNQKNFFQNGLTIENNLNVSGGNKNGSFYLSLGDFRQKGIIPNNEFNRTNIKLTGETSISDKISIMGSATYVNSTSTRFGRGDNFSDVVQGTFRTPPSFDNTLGYLLPSGAQRAFRNNSPDNPFWVVNNNPYTDDVNRIIGIIQAKYDPTSWLNIMYRVGTDVASDKRNQQWARGSFGGDALPGGRVLEDTYNDKTLNSDLIITATKSISDFKFSLMGGQNYFSNYNARQYFDGRDLAIPGLYNISNAQSNLIMAHHKIRKETAALFTRFAVDYKNYLFLELNGRNEWTSTLLAPNNSFFYGGAGVGFVFTDAFKLESDIINFGKIKASYAEGGRDASPYADQTFYNRGIVSGVWGGSIRYPLPNGIGGVELSNVAGNPFLKPERNKTSEIGTELRFLKNRIGLDVTYYRGVNVDQIISVTVPGSTGFTNQLINAGTIENKGWEIVGTFTPVQHKDFRWDIVTNFTRNRNMVLELPVDRIALSGFGNLRPLVKKGEPYSVFYGTGFMRSQNGDVIIGNDGYPLRQMPTAENPSGDIKIGDPNPDFLLGIRNNFSYKGVGLTFLWDIRVGGDVANISTNWQRAQGVPTFTYDRGHMVVFKGVTADGSPNTQAVLIDQASYYARANYGDRTIAERFVEDGSWVRLRDVTLSYNLPKSLIGKIGLKSMDFGIYGRNLLLFTGYSGIDPETNFAGPNTSMGVDAFGTPTTRTYGVSLRAGL